MEKAIQKYEQQGLALIEQARSLKIVDADTRVQAIEFSANCAKVRKEVKKFFAPIVDKAHEAYEAARKSWQADRDLETKIGGKFDEARQIADSEISRDYMEQKRLQDIADAAAREEARLKEEREKAKLLKAAEKAENKGDAEKADDLKAQANAVFVPAFAQQFVPDKTVRQEGATTSMVEETEVVIVNVLLLVRALAENKIPIGLITQDRNGDLSLTRAKLARYAKDNSLVQIPGCQVIKRVRIQQRV